MKIKKILLINFQRHKKLSLKLSDGLTSITAGNNKGKTSVIRALRWVCTNKPLGTWMNRVSGTETLTTTVKIYFEDGTIVKRVKGTNENYYAVGDEEYHDFSRTGIPEKVKELFNLNYSFEEKKLNLHFEDQDTNSLFLVNNTNTERATAINILLDADKIEEHIKFLALKGKRLKASINNSKELIAEYTEDRDKLKEKFDALDFDSIEILYGKYRKISKKYQTLIKLREKKRKLDEIKSRLKNIPKLKNAFKEVLEVNTSFGEKKHLLTTIKRMQDRLKTVQSNIDKCEQTRKYNKKLVALENHYAQWITLTKKLQRLNELKNKFRTVRGKLDLADKVIEKWNKEHKGKECPLCNGKGKL
jgi:exonuclease SbcC